MVAEVLTTVEQNVGACVLGTGLTAAALYGGFRLAGYRLGLTCRYAPVRRRRKVQDDEDDISPEEKEAEKASRVAYSQYQAALSRKRTQEYYRDADKEDQEAERIRREREEFQAQRVAELDAVRAERRAERAAAESAAEEEEQHEPGEQ